MFYACQTNCHGIWENDMLVESCRNQMWLWHYMSKIQIQGCTELRHPLPTTISTSCPLHLVGEEGEKNNSNQEHYIITLREGGRAMMEKERRQRQKMREREGGMRVRAKMSRQAFIQRGVTPIKNVWVPYNMPLTRFALHHVESHILYYTHIRVCDCTPVQMAGVTQCHSSTVILFWWRIPLVAQNGFNYPRRRGLTCLMHSSPVVSYILPRKCNQPTKSTVYTPTFYSENWHLTLF